MPQYAAAFVAYQMSSGMRNFSYQPVHPKFGKFPAHLPTLFGGVRIVFADTPPDFLIGKSTDQIFSNADGFKQLESFRRPDIISGIGPSVDDLFPADAVDFLFQTLDWDDMAHGIKKSFVCSL